MQAQTILKQEIDTGGDYATIAEIIANISEKWR